MGRQVRLWSLRIRATKLCMLHVFSSFSHVFYRFSWAKLFFIFSLAVKMWEKKTKSTKWKTMWSNQAQRNMQWGAEIQNHLNSHHRAHDGSVLIENLKKAMLWIDRLSLIYCDVKYLHLSSNDVTIAFQSFFFFFSQFKLKIEALETTTKKK